MSAKKEILGIDLLRFAAALMVMMVHLAFLGFWTEENYLAQILHSYSIADILGPFSYFGWIGVEIFFVISGFVIAYSAENATPFSFFRSRFVRLMPGIWICCLVAIPSAIWVEKLKTLAFTKLLLKSLILYPHAPWIEGVMWTLPVEICFYAVVFLLISSGRFKYIGHIAAVIGGYSSLYWYVYGYTLTSPAMAVLTKNMTEASWDNALQLSLVHYGLFFSIGVLLWLALIKRHYRPLYLMPFFVAGAFFEIHSTNLSKYFGTNILQPALVPFIIWCGCIGLLVLSIIKNEYLTQKIEHITKGMGGSIRRLGLMTYPLYLLHRPVAYIVMFLLSLLGIHQAITWICGFLSALLVAAFVSSYTEPWVQRKTRAALNHIYHRWNKHQAPPP